MAHQIDNLHNLSIEHACKALMVKTSNSQEYIKSLELALVYEKQAADCLINEFDNEPSRSFLYHSAANIAFDLDNYRESERLIYTALSGYPPEDKLRDLHDLLEQVRFNIHLSDGRITLSDDCIGLSIIGNGIGNGMIVYDIFKRKIDSLQKLILRTIQRLKNPDKYVADLFYSLKPKYPFYLYQFTGGCVSVGLKIGLSEDIQSDLQERLIVDQTIREVTTDIKGFMDDDLQKIEDKYNNNDYYKSFIQICHDMLPDGDIITGLTIEATVKNELISIPITKTKGSFDNHTEISNVETLVGSAQIDDIIVLKGHLKLADATTKTPKIKLIDPISNFEYQIYLDESTIDNVVSSYWDTLVSIKVVKKGKRKLEFLDISAC